MEAVHLPQAKLLFAVSGLCSTGTITHDELIRLKGNPPGMLQLAT